MTSLCWPKDREGCEMGKTILDTTGYLFIAGGYEYGPTIMLRGGEWDEGRYQKLAEQSWYDNEFESDKPAWAEEVKLELQPGKRYRLLIEEVE